MTKQRKKLKGTVEKIIKPAHQSQPEKAQIIIHEGEDLYKEIRVENEMTDGDGSTTSLKLGADVDVIVEADSDATLKKPPVSEKI